MRIGIDISQIVYETGVSVYTRELVSRLVENFPEHEYVLYGGSLRRSDELRGFLSGKKNVSHVITKISPTVADWIWNRLHVFSIDKITGKVDVFHTSDWSEPPANCPKVTTIHDLSFLNYPKLTHPKIMATHKRRLYRVQKESTRVIVPSESSKQDAVKIGIPSSKITVIPEAPSKIYVRQSSDKVEALRKKYRITGNFALAVGANPRKNTKHIVAAFEKAKADAGLVQLVVVGRGEEVEGSGVRFVGHVPTDELPFFYSGASLLIYTSLEEGFGLPILEAFACGCPVLTSNVSSMPEVAGSAAILCDPLSVESISKGVVQVMKNKNKLVKKGSERVKNYSWDMVSRTTMEVYEQAVREKKLC